MENNIIVFVPYCDIYKQFIIKCLQSIDAQIYSRYHVIIVNDGARNTSCIDDFIRGKNNYRIIHKELNEGPASSKWYFLQYIQHNVDQYNYNDVALVIDGDDYLNGDKVFTILNNTYNRTKCWFTYGNSVGPWCTDISAIPPEWGNIRKETWLYSHPRTFKVALAMHFKEDDFKFNGKWLTKGTDRPIVYNCIEMAGKQRCAFIRDVLYTYVEHDKNSYKTVDFKSKIQQMEYLRDIRPNEMIIEDIHIVMCYWKRLANLDAQLANLNAQTVATRIHLHILNNNVSIRDALTDKVAELSNVYTNITLTLSHYDNTYFAFQRFIYIRDVLRKKYIADYVIMMDDDQIFAEDWVETLYAMKAPQRYCCWYGKVWGGNLNYFTGSILESHHCKYGGKPDIVDLHYGGTGGSIIDTSIFMPDTKLWDVPNNLPDGTTAYNIEDLWLSFIIRHEYGWRIQRSFLVDTHVLNTAYSESNANSLWNKLKTQKTVLLHYLVHKYGI